jgi:hypothetical protein
VQAKLVSKKEGSVGEKQTVDCGRRGGDRSVIVLENVTVDLHSDSFSFSQISPYDAVNLDAPETQ